VKRFRQPRPSRWRFATEKRGSVAVQIALMAIVIMGFVSLATEVGYLLLVQREMQSAADSAAVSGATALTRGTPSNYQVEAQAVASASGFTNGSSGTSVTVSSPPADGSYVGVTGAVEVVISRPQTVSLMSLFGQSSINVGVRGVATVGTGTGCALQLISGASVGVSVSNGATLNLTQCGLGSNSTSSTALSMTGGAVVNAQTVTVVGGASLANGSTVNPSSALKTAQPSISDPYASVAIPTYSGCSNGTGKSYGHSGSGVQTLSPGVWCNGVSFTNDAQISLNPGVYIVNQGNFNVGGAVTMTGVGVTIVLTSSTGSNYATVTIGNGASVTLSAPTSGATTGLVFFGDRNASSSNTNNFSGGSTLDLNGVIYFPSQLVIFSNGTSNPSGCTELIAGLMQFTGGATFGNNCSAGVLPINGGASLLVE
jgi:Flp pilus assembly protein TadG